MRDVIHGYRTIYPIGLGLVRSFDPDLVTECTAMAVTPQRRSSVMAGGSYDKYLCRFQQNGR
ncbi:MAG: hypothetical protein E7663_06780 [Ruminococcaceae bacterium]|nr:hypothetical protein [Oscillospiraceae bacterium]